ncbi:hypothetical protein PIROE2DRAFT_8962, partial [Piromyces sp. E2]
MVTEEVEQIIREFFNNFSRNFINNLNTDIMISLDLTDNLFRRRMRHNTTTITLRNMRINTINNELYNNNFDGSTFIKRIFYRNNFNINQILSEFSLHGSPDNINFYLVRLNNIFNPYRTYDDTENNVRRIIENGGELHLTIHDIDINLNNNINENIINFSILLNTNTFRSNNLYSFVIIADGQVQQVSSFFSLINLKQFCKRQHSFIDEHYQRFLRSEPNDFKYYMEVLFRTPNNNRRIPRFNNEFHFPINFYNIHHNN